MTIKNKKVLCAALVIGLSACAQNVWIKPGAGQSEFSAARYDCLQKSQQQQSVSHSTSSGGIISPSASSQSSSFTGTVVNDQMFSACMNVQGWTLQRSDTANQIQQQQSMANLSNQSQYQTLMKQQGEKIKAIRENPEFKVILEKTSTSNATITFAQLADSTKITPAQKPIFLKYRSAITANMDENINIHRTYGGQNGIQIANNIIKFKQLSDKTALDLYNGKITWGEFNQRLKDDGVTAAKK